MLIEILWVRGAAPLIPERAVYCGWQQCLCRVWTAVLIDKRRVPEKALDHHSSHNILSTCDSIDGRSALQGDADLYQLQFKDGKTMIDGLRARALGKDHLIDTIASAG